MPTQKIPSQQRISKSTGRKMMAVAIFFDLMPIGAVLLMMFLIMFGAMGTIGGNLESMSKANSAYNECLERAGDNLGVEDPCSGSLGLNTIYNVGAITAKTGGSVVGAIGAGIFIGPIIYTIFSFVASTLAYIIFITWFYLKGVNILTFGSWKRVLVNLASVIIEYIPGLNLFPSITIGVWVHIKVSRAEDTIKDSNLVSKVANETSNLAYA